MDNDRPEINYDVLWDILEDAKEIPSEDNINLAVTECSFLDVKDEVDLQLLFRLDRENLESVVDRYFELRNDTDANVPHIEHLKTAVIEAKPTPFDLVVLEIEKYEKNQNVEVLKKILKATASLHTAEQSQIVEILCQDNLKKLHNMTKTEIKTEIKSTNTGHGGKRDDAGRPKTEATIAREESPYFIETHFNVVAMAEEITDEFEVWSCKNELHIYDKANGIYSPDEAEIESRIREKLGSLATRHLVAETIADLRSRCRRHIPVDNDSLIPFKNGVLNFQNFELQPHSPDNCLLVNFPVNWDPNIENERFCEFVSQIVPEDSIEVLFQILGSVFHR